MAEVAAQVRDLPPWRRRLAYHRWNIGFVLRSGVARWRYRMGALAPWALREHGPRFWALVLGRRLRIALATRLIVLALRLVGPPVVGLDGVERCVVTGMQGPGPAHATLRLRLSWSWMNQRRSYRVETHAQLGGAPAVEEQRSEVV